MKNKENLFFFYSLVGFILFLFLQNMNKPSQTRFLINEKVVTPKIEANNLSRSSIKWKVLLNNNFNQIQTIFFNYSKLDTLLTTNFENQFSDFSQNHSLTFLPNSSKQYAPIHSCKNAFVMAARTVDCKNQQCSKFNYLTKIRQKHSFNVISLFINPSDLFDFESGIYTTGKTAASTNEKTCFQKGWWLDPGNWLNRGVEWERKVNMQFLNSNGKALYSNECGIRINGNATRGFPQKSFKLIASKEYENKSFAFNFFSQKKPTNSKSLILRNAGNDWGRTMFADYFIQDCIPNGLIDKSNYEPVVLYINGNYWGIYELCERMDEYYISKKYKCKKKNITVLEGLIMESGNETDKAEFSKIILDCSCPKFGLDEIKEKIDLDNFATYVAIQLYIVNTDLHSQNVKTYKIKNNKWKWILHDLDCSYSYSGTNAFNTDMFSVLMKSKSTLGILFNKCMQFVEFKKLLNNKLSLLMEEYFLKDFQLLKFNLFMEKFMNEMPLQVDRWRKPESIQKWSVNCDEFKNFFIKREDVLKKQMKKYLLVQ